MKNALKTLVSFAAAFLLCGKASGANISPDEAMGQLIEATAENISRKTISCPPIPMWDVCNANQIEFQNEDYAWVYVADRDLIRPNGQYDYQAAIALLAPINGMQLKTTFNAKLSNNFISNIDKALKSDKATTEFCEKISKRPGFLGLEMKISSIVKNAPSQAQEGVFHCMMSLYSYAYLDHLRVRASRISNSDNRVWQISSILSDNFALVQDRLERVIPYIPRQ